MESTAKGAKRLGKKVTLRTDWDSVKIPIMYELVDNKFKHFDLAEMLLATKNQHLVEGNWWGDTYWGVCKGVGQNKLGKMLMKLRENLKSNE